MARASGPEPRQRGCSLCSGDVYVLALVLLGDFENIGRKVDVVCNLISNSSTRIKCGLINSCCLQYDEKVKVWKFEKLGGVFWSKHIKWRNQLPRIYPNQTH